MSIKGGPYDRIFWLGSQNQIFDTLNKKCMLICFSNNHKESKFAFDSIATVGEIRVYWRADFQSGSRVLKKVF